MPTRSRPWRSSVGVDTMPNWISTSITFTGTSDDFTDATLMYERCLEPLNIRDIWFERDATDSNVCVYFMAAWEAPCCLARALSTLCPESPVVFEWVDVWQHQRGCAVFLAGSPTHDDDRNGHERVSWTAEAQLAETYLIEYDDDGPGDWEVDCTEIFVSEDPCDSPCQGCPRLRTLRPLEDCSAAGLGGDL